MGKKSYARITPDSFLFRYVSRLWPVLFSDGEKDAVHPLA